jgi:hypothetical protein
LDYEELMKKFLLKSFVLRTIFGNFWCKMNEILMFWMILLGSGFMEKGVDLYIVGKALLR